jgi:hypothetical protein
MPDVAQFPDCWVFDLNHRVYPKGNGICSEPIWREHWRKVVIVSETSRSWVTSCRRKIPKRGGHGIAFSEEDIDRREYIVENRFHIASLVQRLNDYETLKQVAALVGYEEATT